MTPRPEAVVLGASTGALDALSTILPALPAAFPLPILVVVHVPPDKKNLMVDLLKAKCAMDVREAEDKEPIERGTIYFAPPDYHLLVEADRRLSLSAEAPVNFSRPAVDVLFESAAETYGEAVIGAVLTGSNDDGAAGLQAIDRAGGIVLVQSPNFAWAPEMPQAALAACPTASVLTLEQIAARLREVAGR